jgi:hypothetical protein
MHTNDTCTCNELTASMPRASWKSALSTLLGPATRLHHYRDAHTRMIHDALHDLDQLRPQGDCCDE